MIVILHAQCDKLKCNEYELEVTNGNVRVIPGEDDFQVA